MCLTISPAIRGTSCSMIDAAYSGRIGRTDETAKTSKYSYPMLSDRDAG
jgi:hypothetical protein